MANGLGGLIDDQSFDDVYHTTKFLEDVSMLMSVEIGRCEMTCLLYTSDAADE